VARILIADDDAQLRKLLRLALSIRNHEIVEAGNGGESLAQLEASVPDLVLLDWQMAGLSGVEMCRAIRLRTAIPIIAMSAADRLKEALGAGADDFLRKPFDIDELAARIDAALPWRLS